MRWRVALAVAGILLGSFGGFRLLTQISPHNLMVLSVWLVGALIIHDGIVSPLVVIVGAALARFVPARARRHLQAALIMAGLVTVVAVPLIYRRGSQPRSKAILLQAYGAHLTLLLGLIAAFSLTVYAVRVARDARSGRE
jgi:hypothetical protein